MTTPVDELQALARLRFERQLSPAEDARVRTLSFQPDSELERVRLIRARHPDLYGQVLGQLRLRLEGVDTPSHRQEGYELRRQAALDAGVAVPEPDARTVADVDHMAAEYRATATNPYATLDADRRAAFRAAIQSGDFGAVVREWSTWLAEHAERNTFDRRRAAARTAFGHAGFFAPRPAPSFVPELEGAVGGGTIAETMPIIQR